MPLNFANGDFTSRIEFDPIKYQSQASPFRSLFRLSDYHGTSVKVVSSKLMQWKKYRDLARNEIPS